VLLTLMALTLAAEAPAPAETAEAPLHRTTLSVEQVRGGLDLATVDQVVQVQTSPVSECSTGLVPGSKRALELRIGKSGVVSEVLWPPDSAVSDPPMDCVKRKALRWRFPSTHKPTMARISLEVSEP
jgi:hypothetical protein